MTFTSIAVDLDGTLLSSEKRIGQTSLEELKRFSLTGGKIVLASGRHLSQIEIYLDELNIAENLYVICCDGVYIYSFSKKSGKTLLKSECMSVSNAYYISNVLKMKSMSIIFPSCDVHMFRSLLPVIKCKLKAIYSTKGEIPQKFTTNIPVKFTQEGIEKICFFLPNLELGKEINLKKQFTVHKFPHNRFEVLAKSANKYEALCTLEQNGVINLQELLYFGDDYNDIECFENLENTVAMGNASEDIMRIAKYITSSNDNDGVGVAMKKYLR